ncbi:PREDICTED: uncharacterized protein LOC104588576 [Nelumbo nucifera]|uniref:Uncharacterized protein n=2 Tax=Nelumbo nucifera TaxID=4432 RepID=A0A822Y6Q3_NELNU|nr:PREDICTED: uncharacterized protein LOC104588576 [Nelumbo nucifera]DAD27301.1 TPA_asm: hypothetical protein HUJ06_028769 [Nelumbo nucifera]
MRPALLVSLLLLLFVGAQGIRLEQGLKSVIQKKSQEEMESRLIEASSGGLGEVVLCRDGHCSGRSRKLMTQTLSTSTSTTTTSKSVKKNGGTEIDPKSKNHSNKGFGGNEENFSVKSSPLPAEHGGATPEHYPDIIDIAGMDYSPAGRKPPIHN